MVRARRVREAFGRLVVAASGALGISSRTCADGGRERLTATSAPPAETFRAVANSRKSLPVSSLLRTKTGIASGSLGHFRRSVSGSRRFKITPSNRKLTLYLRHLSCQTAPLPLSKFSRSCPAPYAAFTNPHSETSGPNLRFVFAISLHLPCPLLTPATASIFPSVPNS